MGEQGHEGDLLLAEPGAPFDPDLICRYLPDGTITFVNDAYCRYFGRTREDLIGRSFIELIPTADRERALDHLASFTPERPAAAASSTG